MSFLQWEMLQQQRGNALEVMLQKRFTREGVGWDFKVFSSLVFYSKKNSENKAEEIFNFNIASHLFFFFFKRA